MDFGAKLRDHVLISLIRQARMASNIKLGHWLQAMAILVSPISLAVADSNTGAKVQTGQTFVKTEHFDKDPNWEGWQSRITAKNPKTVEQDFGFSATNFAGNDKGEVGGTV